MQPAPKHLIRLLSFDLRPVAFFRISSSSYSSSSSSSTPFRRYHWSCTSRTSLPISALRSCFHLSVRHLFFPAFRGLWVIRCYCTGCPLPSFVTDNLQLAREKNADGGSDAEIAVGKEKKSSQVLVTQNQVNSATDAPSTIETVVSDAHTEELRIFTGSASHETVQHKSNDAFGDVSHSQDSPRSEAQVCQLLDFSQGEPLADTSFMSFVLNEYGWGPHTESMISRFVGRLKPDTVNNVVSETKNAKVAMNFLEWVGRQENYDYQEDSFTKIIGKLGKDMDFSAAWSVLEFMRERGLHVDYAFSVFVHRLKSANMVDEVVQAIDGMECLDVLPTVSLYTSAFQLILKENRLEEAQIIYSKFCKLGLQPDVKLYGLLISGFGRLRKLDDAVYLYKEMQIHGVPPDSFTYVSLIRAFSAEGQFACGKIIFTEMIANSCFPRVFSQLDLGCALHGVRSIQEIEQLLQDIETKGHVINVFTYNNLLRYLLENSMFSEALEVFGSRFSGYRQVSNSRRPNQKETGVQPNVDTYSIIICGLCKNGRLKEAFVFYKEMLVGRLKISTEIGNFLLLGLSNAGLMYEAVELSKHVIKEKVMVSIETQRTFFKALHSAGHVSKAIKIFNDMKWSGCIEKSSNFYAVIGIS